MEKLHRPEGFENEKRDCTVRALSLSGNIPYVKVHQAFKEVGRKNKHGIKAKNVIQKVCKLLDIQATQVKRKGTLQSFINKFPKGKYFCLKRDHAFAVIDGVVHDEKIILSHIKGAWLINKKEDELSK